MRKFKKQEKDIRIYQSEYTHKYTHMYRYTYAYI